ncbi:MAG: anti-sigma factor family protein [Terriglobia bacterium]
MICLTDSLLRARMDGELAPEQLEAAERHLAACEGCRKRAGTLARRSGEVKDLFGSLSPLPGENLPNVQAALAQFAAGHYPDPAAGPGGRSLFSPKWRPAWGALAAAVGIAVIFSFAPARSWAQRMLSRLRVQKVAVVTINPEVLDAENPGGRTAQMMDKLLSDQIVETRKSGKPVPVPNAAAASKMTGFDVRLPRVRSDSPKMMVGGEQAFQMTLDRNRLQSILDEAGRSDLQLPANVNGSVVAVQIPSTVFAAYGNCPAPRRGNTSSPRDDAATAPANCQLFIQVPSPTVAVPPNLNVAQLAEIALQFAGMSQQQAADFTKTVDWTSTLVVPVPARAASYQTVPVDGVDGTLIQTYGSRRSHMGNYTLLWVKNGIIYSLAGAKDPEAAMAFGDSLY